MEFLPLQLFVLHQSTPTFVYLVNLVVFVSNLITIKNVLGMHMIGMGVISYILVSVLKIGFDVLVWRSRILRLTPQNCDASKTGCPFQISHSTLCNGIGSFAICCCFTISPIPQPNIVIGCYFGFDIVVKGRINFSHCCNFGLSGATTPFLFLSYGSLENSQLLFLLESKHPIMCVQNL